MTFEAMELPQIIDSGPMAQIPYFGHTGFPKTIVFILSFVFLYLFILVFRFFILFYTLPKVFHTFVSKSIKTQGKV